MFDIVLDPEFGSNPANPVHGDLVWSQLAGELLGEAEDEEVRERMVERLLGAVGECEAVREVRDNTVVREKQFLIRWWGDTHCTVNSDINSVMFV